MGCTPKPPPLYVYRQIKGNTWHQGFKINCNTPYQHLGVHTPSCIVCQPDTSRGCYNKYTCIIITMKKFPLYILDLLFITLIFKSCILERAILECVSITSGTRNSLALCWILAHFSNYMYTCTEPWVGVVHATSYTRSLKMK